MNNFCHREYEFTLLLAGDGSISDEQVHALYAAGCDDATVSSRSGRVYLTFSRTAASMQNAIVSAIRDVMRAKIGVEVLRIDDCNLVTQAEIARRTDRSRQLIHQYILGQRGPGGFPAPACNISDGAPLWYWCEVADWLCQNNMLKEEVLQEADDIAVINEVLEWERLNKSRPQKVQEILDSLA